MPRLFSPRKSPSRNSRRGRRMYDEMKFEDIDDVFPMMETSTAKQPLISTSTPRNNTSKRAMVKNINKIDLFTEQVRSSRAAAASRQAFDFDTVLGLSPQQPAARRSRSADPSLRGGRRTVGRSMSPSHLRNHRRSVSPSTNRSRSRSRPFEEQRDDENETNNFGMPRTPTPQEAASPYRLGKDMTLLADGINLDGNTRLLLAAYDARTLDDFYLMADLDFRDLLRKARATNNSLPPLQVRKVRILRRWLKDLIHETMDDDSDTDSVGGNKPRKKNKRLVPRDWAEKYRDDLPHLKMQLRKQGDSIFERYPIFQILAGALQGCGTNATY